MTSAASPSDTENSLRQQQLHSHKPALFVLSENELLPRCVPRHHLRARTRPSSPSSNRSVPRGIRRMAGQSEQRRRQRRDWVSSHLQPRSCERCSCTPRCPWWDSVRSIEREKTMCRGEYCTVLSVQLSVLHLRMTGGFANMTHERELKKRVGSSY